MEIALFHRQRKVTLSTQRKPIKDLTRVVAANSFLAEDRRQVLLKKMWELSALEETRYKHLCITLIDNLIAYCQNLPETANSYYSQAGGLVDHALNRTEAALSLFQEFMVQEPSEELSEEQRLWQYALYSAALLQGIGKLFVDYKINLFDTSGQALNEWNPLLEPLGSVGQHYSYEFQKESEVEFRRRINLLLAKTLIPSQGFSWIASNAEVLAVWLALLNEDERSAGTLGAILIRADAISIQRYFTEFMLRSAGNNSGGRYGRAGTFSGGVPESLLEKEQAAGLEFIQWMIKSLDSGHIMINKAPLFMVPGGMLMCQEMFQMFVREHPEYKNWQAVQNGFVALNLHGRGVDGGTISRFEQVQNQQIQSGIVFSKYAIALPGSVMVHNMATGKASKLSAMDLVNNTQNGNQFIQQKTAAAASSLQKLNAAGQWQISTSESSFLNPGARRGG